MPDMNKAQTCKVASIERQPDRVLLWRDERYYIITSHEKVTDIKVGDAVLYEPYGVNFGWFIAKAEERT